MICFDKLKIITKTKYIKNINPNEFISNYKQDQLIYYKYEQKTPCLLKVTVNFKYNELVIEFTSKILKDNFIDLINKNNIHNCFNNINNLGICKLDIDNIINDSFICKCDVTKTFLYPNIKDIKQTVELNISNHKKWISEQYENGGVVIKNVVSTPRSKKRLVFYDKFKELDKSENKPFLNALSNKKDVLEYYKGRIQAELNINTKVQIRKYLNITNNNLINVLNANTNPISLVLDEAVKFNHNINISNSKTLKELEREALLEKYNYDLGKNRSFNKKYQC